ncbi:hypothetical protein AS156_29210 [Bradyrhizobium macuxiense]|uniref:Uncharacterized protein n=1 Tax=Bradyrhizobium macuxiense TaxID=1755647 RepID=A0A109K4C4_9BRAD|nr:hypothetical protein AS156_29210 [Bradyrhizobium macuxiense]
MIVDLDDAFNILRCDDCGLATALLGNQAAEMNNSVLDDYVEAQQIKVRQPPDAVSLALSVITETTL